MDDYYAHSGRKDDFSDWQPLKDHLQGVARLARQFAERARPGDEAFATAAETTGLLHDMWKIPRECCVPRLNSPQPCGRTACACGRFHRWSPGKGESGPFCRTGKS